MFPPLKHAKVKVYHSSEYKMDYAFDIMKAEQIFKYLFKDKHTWLLYGHKIPLDE